MDKKTIKFIEKGKLIHNNKYDYSQVEYINTSTKVSIICPIHGIFNQIPRSHIYSKCGCAQCGSQKQKQTMLDKYGVEHNSHNQSTITARKKTIKSNTMSNPNRGETITTKRKITNLLKHGNENYNNSEKVKQTCIIRYGVDNPLKSLTIQSNIRQTNLMRYGHENIAQGILKEKIQKTMCERYNVFHYNQQHIANILPLITDFDWLYDQYIIQHKTVSQIANELCVGDTCLGRYFRKAEIVIRKTHHSYISIMWLESVALMEGIYIQHNENVGEFKIPGTRYKADGYCQETNTVYEFHGDYWHGNPDIYSPDDMNTIIKKTMGQKYIETIERENIIKSLGYNLVVIWESDWKANQSNN